MKSFAIVTVLKHQCIFQYIFNYLFNTRSITGTLTWMIIIPRNSCRYPKLHLPELAVPMAVVNSCPENGCCSDNPVHSQEWPL